MPPTPRPTQGGSIGSWGTDLNAWIDENLLFRKHSAFLAGAGGLAVVTFTPPTSGFDHLMIMCKARSNDASGIADVVSMRFNGDSTTNHYQTQEWNAVGGTTSTNLHTTNYINACECPTTLSPANSFGISKIFIPFYTETNSLKTCIASTGAYVNTDVLRNAVHFGCWLTSTSAITSIALDPNNGSLFLQGSNFIMYTA